MYLSRTLRCCVEVEILVKCPYQTIGPFMRLKSQNDETLVIGTNASGTLVLGQA